MAVTRRRESDLALRVELIAPSRADERRQEFWWLLGASLLIVCGLVLVYLAKTQDFAAAQGRLTSGEWLNLNTPHSVDNWAMFLATVTGLQSAHDNAGRLNQFLESHAPLPNVGALSRFRIPSAGSATPQLLPLARAKPLLIVRTPDEYRKAFLLWITLYLASFWGVHFAWRILAFRGDPLLLPAVHLLTAIGLILMVSIRDPLRDTLEFRKFALGAIGGCLLLLLPLFKAFQYRVFARWTYTPLFVALALFAALLRFGSGPTGSDAHVNLGPFQPVELIKILVVLFLAGYFATHWNRLRDLQEKRLIPGALRWLELPRFSHALPVMCGIASALILFFISKDLGPALIIGLLFLMLFAVARRRVGLALLGLGLLVGGVTAGYHWGVPHTVVERVSIWLSPWDNPVRGGDQLAHSLWAFATGGTWGSGPGWGDPEVIPAGHTDLVLPSIAEEWGLPGIVCVALLLGLLVSRAYRIALRAPDEYAFFLATGLGSLLGLEMLLISGGALGVIPLSGVVSPFLSSGNTAMLSNFLICALLAGISNQNARFATDLSDGKGRARFAQLFGRPLQIAGVVLGLCACVLIVKAVYLQVWSANDLVARDATVITADGVRRPEHNPRLNLLAAMIPRGNIYDRNGILLATSDWQQFERQRAQDTQLAPEFAVRETPSDRRHYPFGNATLQLLGDWRTGDRFHATNASLVEHDSNKKLQGYDDLHDLAPIVRYRHQHGNPVLQNLLHRDRDVRTTLDIRLQLKLIEILNRRLTIGATRGAAVVMDAENGDVLALASSPAPQPDGLLPDELFDRARYGEYPPGSTFKLVTAVAALRVDANAYRRTFACRRLPDGRVGTIIPGWRRPIRDDVGDHVHGTLDMTRAIAVSCNAYFAQLGVYAVGAKALSETAQLFGIHAGTPAEVKGALPFAAYGQGTVVATPLQMARVAATIAAHGSMPQGRWVLDGSDGRTQAPSRVLTPEAASLLSNAMRMVVTDGTARAAMTGLAVAVAGKTGTAQLDRGQPHSWFAGFAPFEANAGTRQIAFAVIVEHGGYGAKTAAPIGRDIVEAAAQLGVIKSALDASASPAPAPSTSSSSPAPIGHPPAAR